MSKNKKTPTRRTPLPKNFNTIEEFWNFWDTHSSADYEALMEDVSAEIIFSKEASETAGPLHSKSRFSHKHLPIKPRPSRS